MFDDHDDTVSKHRRLEDPIACFAFVVFYWKRDRDRLIITDGIE